MDQSELYSKYKDLQKTDAIFVIENYLRLIKWQNQGNPANILDVGCGDGQVMVEHLLPQLPKPLGKLVGVDVSAAMLNLAKEKYGGCGDEVVDFVELDIAAEVLPGELRNYFQHIFSFYCLHWVRNQKQAFKNMYNMLVTGGDMLLTFLCTNPLYDVYEQMAKNNKWAPYMKDVQDFISPYHHCGNSENVLESLLRDTGFISHVCRVEDRNYLFPGWDILKQSINAVSPFISRIPKEQVSDYVEDYMNIVRKIDNVVIQNCNNNKNDENIVVTYKVFVVFVSKGHTLTQ